MLANIDTALSQRLLLASYEFVTISKQICRIYIFIQTISK